MFIHYCRKGTAIKKEDKNGKFHRILEAAIKVFAKHGFYQSTISEVAKEAGVADGTIYLYFKNKDDILLQFFSYKTKLVFNKFREEVDKADNALTKLKNLIQRHLKEFQNDPDMALVYQSETRRRSPLTEAHIKAMSKMYLDIVKDIINQGQEENSMRRDISLSLVKRFILGAIDEVINNWVLSNRRYDLEKMADPLVDLIVHGIGSN